MVFLFENVSFQEPLPPVPLSGMLNKHGGKVRLTFKPDQDQLWLGTKERTEKLAMTSIKSKPMNIFVLDHLAFHVFLVSLVEPE